MLATTDNMCILSSKDHPGFHDAAVQLGDANRRWLGMLPRQAFLDLLGDGMALLAVEGDRLAGYTLYRRVKSRHEVSITHLCVADDFRRRQVARRLVDALSDAHPGFRSITLKCRRDYAAHKLWPRLGFNVVGEVPGRSKEGHPLVIWRRSHGQPNLLSLIFEADLGERALAVVDLNILLDWQDDRSAESAALLEDWLTDSVKLCVTPESLTEIDRAERARREVLRLAADAYSLPELDERLVCKLVDRVSAVLGRPEKKQELSDRRQLAQASVADADFFVTRDEELLAHATELEPVLGLRVVRPLELLHIVARDSLPLAYQPACLVSGEVRFGVFQTKELPGLCTLDGVLDPGVIQTRQELVVAAHSNPATGHVAVARSAKQPCAAVAIAPVGDGAAQIVAVARPGSRGSTLLAELLVQAVHQSTARGYTRLQIDPTLSSVPGMSVLESLGARRTENGTFQKRLPPRFSLLSELELPAGVPTSDAWTVAWPSILQDVAVPVYVVPIKPKWAERLFDRSRGRLIHEDLLFQFENAYYKSARGCLLPPGSIIAWYQSADDFGHRRSVGAVTAWSSVIASERGPATEVYAHHRHLGVYRWADVAKVAGKEENQNVTAIRFCRTMTLPRPVSLRELRELYAEHETSWTNVITAREIGWELALAIFRAGNPSG